MTIKIHYASTSAGTLSRRSGHTQARMPSLRLDQPGRLRVCHLLALLGVSHSTLYAGIKTGRYPAPDGHDGKLPFWNTATIRALLVDVSAQVVSG